MARTRADWQKQCQQAYQDAVVAGETFARIPLSRGKSTLIDLCDFERVRDSGPWHAAWRGGYRGGYYAANNKTYLHRVLLNAPADMEVDHRNFDTLDNRRKNLRLANHAQNQAHQRKQPGGSSRYIGVHWDPVNGKWRAQIKKLGKRYCLGRYDKEIDAAHAYQRAANKIHGAFAPVQDGLK